MSGFIEDVMSFLQELAQEEELQTVAFQAVKGGLIAGVGAAAGGLLLGPPGFAIGGALGGAGAALACKDMKPLYQVLSEMPHPARDRLSQKVRSFMQKHGVKTVTALAALAAGGTAIRQEILEEVNKVVQNETRRNIVPKC